MKKRIQEKIEAALAQVGSPAPRTVPTPKCNVVDVLVDDVMQNPRTWTLTAIAERHGISYWTVYRNLKGKPGWLIFGRTVRVSESLYRQWLMTAVETGLTR